MKDGKWDLVRESYDDIAEKIIHPHAKEIIAVDTYGDNKGIIADAVLEIHRSTAI